MTSGAVKDPLKALHDKPDGALAVLIRSEGGFPRRPGAMMALWQDGGRVGRLGAGCIDADIAAHLRNGGPVTRLIYGQGGPVDLPLPCGGTVEIALLHQPDPAWIEAVQKAERDRVVTDWQIDLTTGHVAPKISTDAEEGFSLRLHPSCALQIHGEGDEADALTAMAQALGLSCYAGKDAPTADAQTAVVTLFHDHDRELPALQSALNSPAFYIGALGSRRARTARIAALQDMGVNGTALARLHGPIGVIAPVREPRLLAASVLTEILASYDAAFG